MTFLGIERAKNWPPTATDPKRNSNFFGQPNKEAPRAANIGSRVAAQKYKATSGRPPAIGNPRIRPPASHRAPWLAPRTPPPTLVHSMSLPAYFRVAVGVVLPYFMPPKSDFVLYYRVVVGDNVCLRQ